jgi:hypothetical protein
MAQKDLDAYVNSQTIKQEQRNALGESLASGVEQDPDAYSKSLAVAMKTGVATNVVQQFPNEYTKQARLGALSIESLVDNNPKVSQFLSTSKDNSAISHDDTQSMSALEYLIRPVDYARSAVAGAVKSIGSDISGRGVIEDIGTRNGLGAWDRMFGTAKAIAQAPLTIYNISTAPAKIDAKAIGGDIKELGNKIAPPKERQAFDTEVAEGIGQISSQIVQSMLTGGSTLYYQGADAMNDKVAKDDSSQARKDAAVVIGASITGLTEKYGLDKILNRVPPQVKNRTLRFISDKAAAFGIEFAQELTENIAQDVTRQMLTNPEAPIGEGVLRESTVAGTAAAIVRTALGIKSFRQAKDQQEFIESIADKAKSSKLRERSPEKFQEFIDLVTENGPVQQVFVPQEQFKQYFQSVNKDPEQVAKDLGITNYAEAELAGGDLVIPMNNFVSKIAPSDDLQGLMSDIRLAQGFDTPREAQEKMANLEADIAALREQYEKEDQFRGAETTAMQEIKADIEGQLVQLGMTAKTANDYATIAAAGFRGISTNAYKNMTVQERESMVRRVFKQTEFKVSMPMATILKDKKVDMQLDPLLESLRSRSSFDPKKIYGPSLIEFLNKRKVKINDEMGELVARDIDVGKTLSKRLIAGKGEAGMGLEEAALIAYDFGYITEQNEALFLDALDEDLRGNPVYSAEFTDVTAETYVNQLENLQSYLERNNIDVRDMTNDEIRAKLDEIAAQPEAMPDYYQGVPRYQLDAVRKQYENTDQWLRAPDGSPTNLTEDQWLQVRTPEFKTWFGDWEQAYKDGGVFKTELSVSKVVGKNGEPLIVYHGTDNGGFSIFDTPNGINRGDLGIFATSNREMARTYIKRGRETGIEFRNNYTVEEFEEIYDLTVEEEDGKFKMTDDMGYDFGLFNTQEELLAAAQEYVKDKRGNQSGVYELFMNIRDVYESDFEGANWNGNRENQWVVIDQDGQESVNPATGSTIFTDKNEADLFAEENNLQVIDAPQNYETTDDAVQEARKLSNDGAIIYNVIDDGGGIGAYAGEPSDVFVAFKPEQVKAASGNVGTFRGDSPNIFYQTIDKTETEEFKKWSNNNELVREGDYFEYESGVGVVVEALHGTTGDFEVFDLSKANPESDMGAGFYFSNTTDDVGTNYAGLGPDLTQKVERLAEQIADQTDRKYDDPEVMAEAKAKFMTNQGFTMPVYVRFDNPAVLGGNYETTFTLEQEYNEETDEFGDVTGTLVDFVDALKSVEGEFSDVDATEVGGYLFEYAADRGEMSLSDIIHFIKDRPTGAQYATDEDGAYVVSEFIRRGLEEAGFDGVIDTTVSSKFKSMTGMNPDTVHYIAFGPKQIKSRYNKGTFGVDTENILYQKTQENLEVKRGYVKFGEGKNKTVEIALLEKRDMSTFLHEMGHVYLEILGDVAQDRNSSDETKADYATILNFLGVKDRSEIGVKQHEMFARAHEAYLREGKAPSAELRSVFQKFKAWLTRIYKTLQQLDIELNDEVRQVFDRIYATEQEIQTAKTEADMTPLFASAQDANMTDAEFEAYTTAVRDEIEVAKEKLEQKLLKEFEREQKIWWKESRAEMRKVVEQEVNEMPVYQAFQRLSLGALKGEESIKLSYLDLVARYGEAFVKTLPRPYVYAKKGGLDADSAAEMLGYETGDDLVQALAQMKPRKEYIEAETDERMKETYGDIQTDGSFADEARMAMHNESRANVLSIELKAIKRKQREAAPFVKAAMAGVAAEKKMALDATRVPPLSAFRAMAKGIIGAKRVADITPYDYLLAERRYNREAFKAMAKGEYQDAAIAKQKELINHYMYLEATKARQDIDKAREYLATFDKKATRERVGKAGQEYLDQIDTLLEGFELKRIPLLEIERRMKLADFVAQREAEGEFVNIPQELIDKARTTNYKQATYDEFAALRDAVKNIEHLAKFKDKLMVRQKAREFANVKSELLTSLKDNREPTGDLELLTTKSMTMREKGAKAWRKFDAAHLKVEQIVEWLDGGQIDGPWSRYFFDLADEAQTKEYDLHRTVTKALRQLQENMPRKWQQSLYDKVAVNLPAAKNITKYDLIGIALNSGNSGNRDRLKSGRTLQDGQQFPWTDEQIDAALTNLTKEDWQFVQGVWDTVNLLWTDISSLQVRMTGIAPPKVEAQPFQITTKQGETINVEGGYFPIVYDYRMSDVGKKQAEAQESVQDFLSKGHGRATTAKGHTISRVDTFSAPINLDWSDTLTYHMSNVIKDISHREAILGINKILNDKEIALELEARLGGEYTKLLKEWTRTLVSDRADSLYQAQGLAKVFMKTRTNMAIVTMGFKATTVLAQIAGIGPALDFVSPRSFYKGLVSFMTSPKETYAFVTEKSGEIRNRLNTIDRDVKDGLAIERGQVGVAAAVRRTAFYATGVMDMMVSIPTWMAAYNQALTEGKTDQDAVRAGDRAVRLSQGASGAKDMAAVQRNNELTRLLTMYYTPFSALYARLRDIGKTTKEMKDLPRAAARLMALVIFPAIVGELLAGRGPDDDEDEVWWAARKVMLYPMATIPVVRDFSGLTEKWMINIIGEGEMEFAPSYRLSPIVGAIEKVSKIPSKIGDVVVGDKEFDDVAWDIFESSGYVLGLPTAQARITGEYLQNLLSGEAEPENAADVLKGLLFRPKKD